MTEYKEPSTEAMAVVAALDEVESIQKLLSKATKRLHNALGRLAKKHNLDPNVVTTQSGGGKGGDD